MKPPPLEEQIAELRQAFDLLRSSVKDMQEEYAREVRTKRVTVVDESGTQRVILSAEHRTGSVLVRLDRRDRRHDAAELYASEDPQSGAPEVGLCLIQEGNIVSTWRCG